LREFCSQAKVKGKGIASEPIRDPVKDHLLTPRNSTFIIIDYQPVQVNSVASMDRQLLINNSVGASKAAVTYSLPIVHSTVNVKTGVQAAHPADPEGAEGDLVFMTWWAMSWSG
jgi:nicotinamidase-related amidase